MEVSQGAAGPGPGPGPGLTKEVCSRLKDQMKYFVFLSASDSPTHTLTHTRDWILME